MSSMTPADPVLVNVQITDNLKSKDQALQLSSKGF